MIKINDENYPEIFVLLKCTTYDNILYCNNLIFLLAQKKFIRINGKYMNNSNSSIILDSYCSMPNAVIIIKILNYNAYKKIIMSKNLWRSLYKIFDYLTSILYIFIHIKLK